MSAVLRARFGATLKRLNATDWNALRDDANPFLDHAFLAGLEIAGCIRPALGWQPYHLTLTEGERLVGAVPLYLKGNSHGEYVFDHAWANAYDRHGLDYYPKLLAAVPYTPISGPRLLARDAAHRAALVAALVQETQRLRLSSAHVNFVSDTNAQALADAGWLARSDWQFHWVNRGWPDFDAFLAALAPKKRRNIQQERAAVARAGVVCEWHDGAAMTQADWDFVHCCYLATFEDKGNTPALTADFFRYLGAHLPAQVGAVIARRGAQRLAAALFLRSEHTLYGRYWGALEHVPGLHFEACYYQGLDYCLRRGLTRFEPGAQGEHKLARGFLPERTRSFHWIADLKFRAAIADALRREAQALDAYHADLMRHSPYAVSL